MSRRISRGQRAHLLWLCSERACLHFWLRDESGKVVVPGAISCARCRVLGSELKRLLPAWVAA